MKRVAWFVVVVLGLSAAGVAGAASAGGGPGWIRLQQPRIEIWKSRHALELRDGSLMVRRFEVALGIVPKAPKRMRGDLRTPVGRYYVTEKRPSPRFHRFMGISYPNITDAERGYRERLIDAQQWGDIFFANLRGEMPTWRTPLGGLVGIHGWGARPPLKVDWTEGCIAVGNDEIEFLYDRVPVGTPVLIYE